MSPTKSKQRTKNNCYRPKLELKSGVLTLIALELIFGRTQKVLNFCQDFAVGRLEAEKLVQDFVHLSLDAQASLHLQAELLLCHQNHKPFIIFELQ